jgi:small subunit ribosomal protein S16
MSVKIRLRRTGKRNAPCHRIVVADSRSPRDGRFIEAIGVYDPRRKQEKIDLERVDYWCGQGAQMSETVAAIAKRARSGQSYGMDRSGMTVAQAEAAKAVAPETEAETATPEPAATPDEPVAAVASESETPEAETASA